MTAKEYLIEKVKDAWLVDEMAPYLDEYAQLQSEAFAEWIAQGEGGQFLNENYEADSWNDVYQEFKNRNK